MKKMRHRLEIRGTVQGVGFRPFVFRQAQKYEITGFVRNTLQGVAIEIEGSARDLRAFAESLESELPAAAKISNIQTATVALRGDSGFRIIESVEDGAISVTMPHDRATCGKCLAEMRDAQDIRYHFPFITCNDCGPRFTIAKNLPFDRTNTTMAAFEPCLACRKEYLDPENRRFYAQTISCPNCGPALSFQGKKQDAISRAVAVLKDRGLIAVKGIGGYQLICSANAEESIAKIRNFKQRKMKPFAVMAPDLNAVEELCHVNEDERNHLCSPAAPIVLLPTKDSDAVFSVIHPEIFPGLKTLGVMLPANPIHHLLMDAMDEWLVVTSANRKGEPILIDDMEAEIVLKDLVDGILAHNREIMHLADDSVIRDASGRQIILRLGRGLAPCEIHSDEVIRSEMTYAAADSRDFCSIAVGGHTKAAFALGTNHKTILSQHMGDLTSRRALDVFCKEIASYETIYRCSKSNPKIICHDVHPDYGSNAVARDLLGVKEQVYHHEAHLESLLAECGDIDRALAVVCDGSGLGTDGSIWGGEFFLVEGSARRRIGSLLPFQLPGGELAIREPRRSAFGLMYQSFGAEVAKKAFIENEFTSSEIQILLTSLARKLNAPYTTSLGRLFDGLAAILSLCTKSDYESQAAMALEGLAGEYPVYESFPVSWSQDDTGLWRWDWRNLVGIACEVGLDRSAQKQFAAAFHATIIQAIEDLAKALQTKTVLLSGGVFQNALLVELAYKRLPKAGMKLVTHCIVPPGDGGLAVGQLAVGRLRRTT